MESFGAHGGHCRRLSPCDIELNLAPWIWRSPCVRVQWNTMLRVTVRENGRFCRLELAGKLGGPWVEETEQAFRSASCPDKQIEVDIRQVTAVDSAGRELLSAMYRTGARLLAQGVEMTALIDEITGKQPIKGFGGRAKEKKSR